MKAFKVFDAYVHHGKTWFPTGLDLNFLQEYYLIALDVFQKFPYPKIRSEQTAWLSLLTTRNMEEAENLMEEYKEYPWIQEIYEEMAMLRQRPEEVLNMFSEALRILDRNTVNYMIEELQKELEEKDAVIEQKDAVIEEKEAMMKAVIEEKEVMMKAVIEAKDAEIEELKKRLEQVH